MLADASVRKVGTTAAPIDLGVALLDVVAQIGAELDGLGEHAQALGFDRGAVRGGRGPRDAQLSRVRADLLR